MILDGHGVEPAIIDIKVQTTIWLLDKQDKGTERGFGWADPASFQHSINVFLEISKFCFGEVVDGAVERFGSRSKRNFIIYAGAMWRELRDFFIFEDISELGVFERDWCGSSGSYGDGFGGNVVGGEVGIKVNRGGEGFLVASDVGNYEKKEFVAL